MYLAVPRHQNHQNVGILPHCLYNPVPFSSRNTARRQKFSLAAYKNSVYSNTKKEETVKIHQS